MWVGVVNVGSSSSLSSQLLGDVSMTGGGTEETEAAEEAGDPADEVNEASLGLPGSLFMILMEDTPQRERERESCRIRGWMTDDHTGKDLLKVLEHQYYLA